MIESVRIKNFKSIVDLTIPLSNINVFIGENGCGKSNILEAIGFAAEGSFENFRSSNLYYRGIRNAKPSLIFNSFREKAPTQALSLDITYKVDPNVLLKVGYTLSVNNYEDTFPEWVVDKVATILGSDQSFDTNDQKAIADIWRSYLYNYVIYTPHTTALRGLSNHSQVEPVGINGEDLDVLISSFDALDQNSLKENAKFIDWLDDYFIDSGEGLKVNGYRANRGKSKLYFKDKFMQESNNIFSAENANEGVLHVLFYMALMISKRTPPFFAIDNIETGLNPKLCRDLIQKIGELAAKNNKQVLITTHNPAILDGLNLNDDRQRLFVVSRKDEGYTKIERIKTKPSTNGEQLKLSEMWMRGYLGGLPTNF